MGTTDIFKTKIKLPQYDEITLFFINLLIVTLFIIDPGFRQDFIFLITSFRDPRFFIMMFLGFLFTIYSSLFEEKGKIAKTVMGGYIVFLNLFIGGKAIYYLYDNNQVGLNIIFPAIDVLISIIIIGAMRGNFVDSEELISDRQAKRKELVVGLVFVPLIVGISEYLLKNNWVITFSICLFYVGLIHSFLVNTIFRDYDISPTGATLAATQNERSKLYAKAALTIIFVVGVALYFGFLSEFDRQEKENYNRRQEEAALIVAEREKSREEERDFFDINFWLLSHDYFQKDISTLYNDALNKKEGDEVRVKGVVKGWVPEKFMPKEINGLDIVKNPRIAFYELKREYYTENRYYTFCNSDSGKYMDKVIEFDGVISDYNVYGNDVKVKCILPKGEIKVIDTGPIKNKALKSYKAWAKYVRREVEAEFKKNRSITGKYETILSKFTDTIENYDSVAYYWAEDRKRYIVLFGFNLEGSDKLYLTFSIDEKEFKTQSLEIFIGSGK